MRVHSWVHVQLGLWSNIQVISSEAAIQMFMACTSACSSSTWHADFYWTLWGFCWPSSGVYQDPFRIQLCHLSCQPLPPNLLSSWNLLRVHCVSWSRSLMKIFTDAPGILSSSAHHWPLDTCQVMIITLWPYWLSQFSTQCLLLVHSSSAFKVCCGRQRQKPYQHHCMQMTVAMLGES